jgi:hypothetical protein
VYLRERAAQLRQDLALGEGPVLTNLALQRRVSSRRLGLILRAHRAELSGLVGEETDTTWPVRFLEKVDQLMTPKSASAARAETEPAG